MVVAAGRGTRFGGWKQLAPMAGKPLLIHCLEAFAGLAFAARRIVVPTEWLTGGEWDALTRAHPAAAAFAPVGGGVERALSVRAGVEACPPECRFVAVHDGARPFPPLAAMEECVRLLGSTPRFAAAIVAGPATDTIKRVGPDAMEIMATEDRTQLRRAETPQVAHRELLLEALSLPSAATARDEAEALERAGHRTACVTHHAFNLKVTHPEDLGLASAWHLLRSQADDERR